MPSVIFGVLTVVFTYLIAKKLYDKKTALIAAILMGTAPLAIYYSQEARMYSLAAAATALSVYFFISIIKKDTIINWVGFILSTTVMLYSDYLSYFMIPIYIIYLFLSRKNISKSTLKAFIPAFLLIFIAIAPWLTVFTRQLRTGLLAAAASPAWAQVVGTPSIKTFFLTFVKFTIGRISSNNKLLYAALFAPVGAFITFLFAISFFRVSKLRSFLWLWFLGPLILAFTASYFIPIFTYFRFIFVLPAFYIILASAINTINWTPLVRVLLVITLAINLTAAAVYFTNTKFQREDWKGATAYVIGNSTQSTVTLFEDTYTVGPFDYYNKGRVKAYGALDSFSPDPAKVHQNVASYTNGKNNVFLFAYLSPITDPQGLVFEELTKEGYTNTSTKDFEGVGFVYEFKK